MAQMHHKALIVDDEYYLGQILAQALEHEGISSIAVTDVDSAIEKLNKMFFDVVISDIYLPGKTGRDLFEHAREHFPDTPFIFMTGNPDLEMAVYFLKQGGYDYITKPFMIPDFIKKVKAVIKTSEQRRKEKSIVQDLKQILNHRLKELNIYQDIIESTDDGLLILDTEGLIVKINRGFEKLTGLPGRQVVNQPISYLQSKIHPDLIFENIFQVIKQKGKWQKELTLKTNKGECVANISFFPIKDDQQNIFAYAALIKDVTEQRNVEKALIDSLRRTNLAQEAIIFGLARLAEYRDRETGFHLERMRNYCVRLAEELANHPRYRKVVNESFINMLNRTAPLHDIGKVGIPDYILLKADKLTEPEYEIMKTHTTIGYQILRSIEAQYGSMDFLTMGMEITYCHHERWDGKGYPRGIKEDDIPLAAQIVAIADVYDALTTERTYKVAYPHEKSLEIMKAERGQHFSPGLFDAFLTVTEEFQAICYQFQEGGSEKKIVI